VLEIKPMETGRADAMLKGWEKLHDTPLLLEKAWSPWPGVAKMNPVQAATQPGKTGVYCFPFLR